MKTISFAKAVMIRHPWFALVLLALPVTLGCRTKSPQTSVPREKQPISLDEGSTQDQAETPEANLSESPEPVQDNGNQDQSTEVLVEEDQPATHHHHVSEPVDPRLLLEGALEALEGARELWKAGNLDVALEQLDRAYGLILDIDEEHNPDILQEKEDVRFLISKRIVEIYAAQRTVVGDVEKSIPLVMNDHVAYEIKSFQTRERKFFLASYARSGRYRPMILKALEAEGLPEQLSWLPLIESGFKTNALSRARALGMWQFIPSTGYRFDLNRNSWMDERMDPEKSTGAAIRYLVELHNLFGDWLSALAAYNCGEGRVLRAIKSQHINYLDDFWDLYQSLPRETARYVPRFIATLLILKDPEKYGIELPPLEQPVDYQITRIQKSVKLSDLDALAGLKSGSFHKLNPELRLKITPEKEYDLKVPTAKMDAVLAGFDGLPRWQIPIDSDRRHRVRRGETLSTIAARYKTSVNRIVRANGLRNKHRISVGQRLKIPGRSGRPVAVSSVAAAVAAERESGQPVVHKVTAGDSLWRLAKKYKTTINEIRALNGISGNHLRLGQVLKIKEGGKPSSRIYLVKRGDTLSKIAQAHRVRLNALLKANNLTKRDRIYPNQQLVVP